MTREAVFIVFPLIGFFVAVSAYEIRTGLIKDIATLPALLYTLIARSVIGPQPWYYYVMAAVSMFALLALAFITVPQLLRRQDWIGAGAVSS